MKDLKNIASWIEDNSESIISNIEQESVAVYLFLQEQFAKTNVTENHLFQFVYRSFYRLDNAGLTPEFKTEYFRILEENKGSGIFDFDSVLRRLHGFKNRKDQESMQFSFVTKLFNTIDPNSPIYDSAVATVFSFKRPYAKDFDAKLEKYLNQLETINNAYTEIRNNQLLSATVGLFNKKFPGHNLSEVKILDFIFWSAGKILESTSHLAEDGYHTIAELDKIDEKLSAEAKVADINPN